MIRAPSIERLSTVEEYLYLLENLGRLRLSGRASVVPVPVHSRWQYHSCRGVRFAPFRAIAFLHSCYLGGSLLPLPLFKTDMVSAWRAMCGSFSILNLTTTAVCKFAGLRSTLPGLLGKKRLMLIPGCAVVTTDGLAISADRWQQERSLARARSAAGRHHLAKLPRTS